MKASRQLAAIIIVIAAIFFIILYFSAPATIMSVLPPNIKNLLWIIFIVSGILLLLNYLQPPKPPPPPGEGPPELSEIKVTVLGYGSNPMNDIDKILVQQNNQKIWLHFPPHTARQVLAVAEKNTTIFAEVHPGKKHKEDSLQQYELVSLRSDALGKSVDVHELPPPQPTPGNDITVTGKSIDIQPDETGRVKVFVLSGKLIALPPRAAETLLPLMKQSHEIVVKGYERNAEDGFVNSSGLPFIKAYSISIDHVNYVIQ